MQLCEKVQMNLVNNNSKPSVNNKDEEKDIVNFNLFYKFT